LKQCDLPKQGKSLHNHNSPLDWFREASKLSEDTGSNVDSIFLILDFSLFVDDVKIEIGLGSFGPAYWALGFNSKAQCFVSFLNK